MPIPMLFLPPPSDNSRAWAKAVADACPELEIIVPETREGAEQAMALAEGAFGTIPKELLPRAGHLAFGCRRRKPHRLQASTTPS